MKDFHHLTSQLTMKQQRSRQYSIGAKTTDQWNIIEIPEIGPHIYGQVILDKDAKVNSMEKG